MLIKNVELNGQVQDVRISGNQFSAIEPRLEPLAKEECIDGMGLVLLPPFVNAHTHASMSILRGYADDKELHDWLTNYIWPQEAKLTEEDIYHGARLTCLEMIKSGTTCFADMYWHFPGIVRAVEEMGLRALLSCVFIDFNDTEKALEQQALSESLFKSFGQYAERITFSLGPHAIYTVSEASLKWIAEFAEKHSLLIHIHLAETEKEVEDCIELHGVRPVEYLDRIGLLGPNLLAAHVIHVSDAEITLLSERGVKVVHNPASNMKLCSGSFPYARMNDAGVLIALGTDGCSSNNNLDMLEEMKIASLHAKCTHQDPTIMPAEEIYKIATQNGAKALRIDGGEIAVGKLADCILVNRQNHRLVPGHNLISDLTYSADASCIHTVICDGKTLMKEGIVNGEDAILRKARAYAKK